MRGWTYNGYDITPHNNGFTVFFDGDEIYFSTMKKAYEFINEVENRKLMAFANKYGEEATE